MLLDKAMFNPRSVLKCVVNVFSLMTMMLEGIWYSRDSSMNVSQAANGYYEVDKDLQCKRILLITLAIS